MHKQIKALEFDKLMSQVLSISSISIKKATLVPFGTRVCKILNLSFILSLLLYTTQEKKPFMRERERERFS
jgi:hypothetical protein